MKYHQLRVAALSNALHRAPRGVDTIALHCWHLWATREDCPIGTPARGAWNADYLATMERRGYRVAPLASAVDGYNADADVEFYDELEAQWEREHIRSYRSTYFTRRNLL